ncbi:MAG: c-type cytochrome [Pseudomonadota bacterium]
MRHLRLFQRTSSLICAAVFAALSLYGGTAAAGDAASGKAKAGTCAGCHGLEGHSGQPIWPHLAGQSESYLAQQLRHFKSKARDSAQMYPMVMNLSNSDMDDLAAWFASLSPATGLADPSVVAEGERLYRAGDPNSGVPACMSCHGPAGKGMNSAAFPAVSGQHAQYSLTQLKAFASGQRATDPAGMMRQISARLSESQMRAVSEYMAGLR